MNRARARSAASHRAAALRVFAMNCVATGTLLAAAPARASVNSYRFLHVTIDTPWHIFLFLLMGIFAPFVLMVVLMWRNSIRKRDIARQKAHGTPGAASHGAPPPQSPPPPQT